MHIRKNKKRPHQKCYHPENAHIKPINTFLMKKRLSWFGHVQRKTQAEVDGPIKIRHEENQHTPRVGIRHRELVQHDEKRQPYPGNDGKVRRYINKSFAL